MEIAPRKTIKLDVEVSPDKSITHRAIMLNSIAEGKAKITNALLGDDCKTTIECMRALGAEITVEDSTVTVKGSSKLSSCKLDAKNSGTTMRLLSGLLCSQSGTFEIDGDESLRRRPMKRIIEPLQMMRADIGSSDGEHAPIMINGKKLKGISYRMPIASAQVKSSILLAGLGADGITTVHEKLRTRNHTEIMLNAMNAKIWMENYSVSVMRSKLTATNVCVPGDISSGAYPLVLGAMLGGEVTVRNVGVNTTRTGILTVLQECGVDLTIEPKRGNVEKIADVTLRVNKKLKPFAIGKELIPFLIDEIPVLAVLATCIDGESVISGAEELRVKESNRIDATVEMLTLMGADVESRTDGMIIHGGKKLKGGCTINPRGDHRIAMSAAVAGCASQKGIELLNPECVKISYPNFFEMLAKVE